jgi:hypothetical protein
MREQFSDSRGALLIQHLFDLLKVALLAVSVYWTLFVFDLCQVPAFREFANNEFWEIYLLFDLEIINMSTQILIKI